MIRQSLFQIIRFDLSVFKFGYEIDSNIYSLTKFVIFNI